MPNSAVQVRRAIPDDLEAITTIYNHEVEHRTATLDTTPVNLDGAL